MKFTLNKVVLTVILLGHLAVTSGAAMAFEPEKVTVAVLKPNNPDRLYLPDPALSHIADGRMFIVDGARMKMEGMIGTGFSALTTLSPDRREIYVATSYWSRISRGTRTELLEIYDALTLKIKTEIPIPPKHAQALPYRGLIRTSSDGRYVMIQNATPATSITVVDLKNKKFLFEVQTPGCWSVEPSFTYPTRFSTICGDGTMLTIGFDEAGKIVSQKRSEKFFDADADPIFAPAQNIGDDYVFISFKGVVHPVNVGGDVAKFAKPWSLVSQTKEIKENWRPGGYQFFAIHQDSKRMFVGMHPDGKDGTHKAPAKEIWEFDLIGKKRIAQFPASNALAVAVTQSKNPKLFVLDGVTAGLVNISLDAKHSEVGRINGIVEMPVAIEVQ